MTVTIRRRELLFALGGAAAAWPLAARALDADRVAADRLMENYSRTNREGQARTAAFLETLRRLGWTSGRNVCRHRISLG